MYVDFSKIMQEAAECDEGQFLLRQMTEHPHHRRENSDIDTVCERVGIVCTDVRQLDEVVVVVEEVKNDGIRHLLQCGNVQCSIFLDGLECVVDCADRVNTRLFLDYIRRRYKFVARIHGCHSDGLDAKLVHTADIVNRYRLALDEITAPRGIEQTLSKYHTIL